MDRRSTPGDRVRPRGPSRLLVPLAADDARARFWVRHVRVGVALSEVSACVVIAYVLLADRPHRAALLLIAGVVMVCSPLLLAVPIDRLSLSSRAPLIFYLWSLVVTAVVAAIALLDGGADSPLLWLLVLTMAFAALAYPPLGVLLMGAVMGAAYLAVAAVDSSVDAGTFLVVAVLLSFTVMTAWISRNHWETHHQQVLLTARLAELDRARDEFVATTCHELRTPVTSILGYLELLEFDQGRSEEEHRRFVTTIRRNAERLQELSEDLLVLSRWDIEKRSRTGEEQPFGEVDLAEVLDRVRATMTPLATRQGVALTFDVPDGPLVVTGLAEDLERALLNLLSNAVKYTPAGGDTGCLVHQDAGVVVIEVCDSGIGIADDEIERLFTRFFRASSARERSIAGIGLGLSIVQEIVAAHAGDITVSSRLGEGTVVVVRLPLAATDPSAWSPTAVEQPRQQASLA